MHLPKPNILSLSPLKSSLPRHTDCFKLNIEYFTNIHRYVMLLRL